MSYEDLSFSRYRAHTQRNEADRFFISVLLNTLSSSVRDIMMVWNQWLRLGTVRHARAVGGQRTLRGCCGHR